MKLPKDFFTEDLVEKTNTYEVPVSWLVSATAIIEASDPALAADIATGMDLDTFENADYVEDSFDVDWDNIRKINPPKR